MTAKEIVNWKDINYLKDRLTKYEDEGYTTRIYVYGCDQNYITVIITITVISSDHNIQDTYNRIFKKDIEEIRKSIYYVVLLNTSSGNGILPNSVIYNDFYDSIKSRFDVIKPKRDSFVKIKPKSTT